MPRKAAIKGAVQVENVEDGHAGTNGDVVRGRSLRARKPVDYKEDNQSSQKVEAPEKSKNVGKKAKRKSPGDGERIAQEDLETGLGSSYDEDSDNEIADTRKINRKTVSKEGSSNASLECTFVVKKTSRKDEDPNKEKADKKINRKTAPKKGPSNSSLNSTFVVKKTSKRNANYDMILEADEESEPETKKPKEKGEKLNETSTDYSKIIFDNSKKTSNGEEWNLKISSWNVDGLRAWLKKGGAMFLEYEKPDIFCLQETKCSEGKIPPEAKFKGYHCYWASGEKEGYSGVALFSKEEPISVKYGMGIEEQDTEGRLITAEYDNFFVVTTYVPNAGKGLVTLPKRLSWDSAFRQYLKELDDKKPVILCGDMNVSHQEIDLANPKTNTKNAGFTKEERDGMTELLAQGLIDTFRHFYPKEAGAYTFWTYMRGSRSRNVGWRLDYFIMSERLINLVCDSIIRNQVLGSDHCPITLLFHNK